jgi:hypothetical protein
VVHALLQCNELQQWREQFLHNKWPYINEETAYKKITGYNKITELKSLSIFLGKATCKCENKVTKMVQDIEEMREEQSQIEINYCLHVKTQMRLTTDRK